jgi:hypothetical protein
VEAVFNLPLGTIQSTARFVVLDADLRLVSEHGSGEEACRALAKLCAGKEEEDGVILYRTALGWLEF